MRRMVVVGLLLALGACTVMEPDSQRYVVFFQEWSADMDATASGSVTAAAAWAKQHPSAPVIVSGYADPEGSPQANKDLSRLRAQVVADALVADGVALARIQRQAVGSVDYVMNSLESRRVEIVVGRR
ncbi:OmpA family protein [Limobrevibacterium gyesilva]|uniref:OmpA family protein n=1 Tax=Limobrevibacterium gyesilva TaxID=2991712 RepID=A0AA41YL89_9PROT|nr:OmpA family protein [Limobrevibacterium gyesilva]MCW3473983.1 OmpA family protein [Limobrevibacterium gyesilva]